MTEERVSEIVKCIEAVFLFVVWWIGGMVLGIFIAFSRENYFLLSFFSYWWLELFCEFSKKSLIRRSKKLEEVILNKYPHYTRLMLRALMLITILSSIKVFCAFIFFVIASVLFLQVNKGIHEKKEQERLG